MACENCSDEMRSVIRSQNRALRLVNRNLRRKTLGLEEHADDLFYSLCETNPQAELALREIWERAGLAPSISSDDYITIVEVCVAAIKATHVLPAATQH